jgi:hypothetical protein
MCYSTGMSVQDGTGSGTMGKRLQGHPLKSFSVPAPPPQSAPSTPQQKHVGQYMVHHILFPLSRCNSKISMFKMSWFCSSAPSVTVRPQGSSPYKKAGILASGAAVTAKGRTVTPGPSTVPTVAVPTTSEDVSRMQVRFRRFFLQN